VQEAFDKLCLHALQPIPLYGYPPQFASSTGGKSNMATLPAVGSRVRYTVEGVVQRVDDRWGRKVVVVKNGKGVSTDIDVTNPGLDAEVLSRPFIPGKRYRTTPTGQFEGVRTTFGKWLVTKHHIDPSMVGEVLTDEKFIALRNEDPEKRARILDTMELVD
jgi:hypothetical protein